MPSQPVVRSTGTHGAVRATHHPRALPVQQPVLVDSRVATVWESVSAGEEYGDIRQVATLIRGLHRLQQPDDLELPELNPFARADTRLDSVQGIVHQDLEFLRASLADARAKWDQLEFVLPRGPVHGGANVGNVLRADDGHAVLIDLDGFAVGPREWDLIQTAIFYDRFGWHTREEYEAFVEVYGYDLLEWSGYPALASIREAVLPRQPRRPRRTGNRDIPPARPNRIIRIAEACAAITRTRFTPAPHKNGRR